MCGDFNLDLLKIESDHNCQHFFNLLSSYGFLPHILQPTRVTENTAAVINNIFSNNIQDNIVSGNILLTLSEHFSQFLSVKREKVDLKKINIYQRNYSKFSSESFLYKTGFTLIIMFMTPLRIFTLKVFEKLLTLKK